MKIRIRTDSCHLRLRIPNRLLYCSLTFKIAEKAIQEHTHTSWTLDKETRYKVQEALQGCCKQYKGLALVDVETAKGEKIQIIL